MGKHRATSKKVAGGVVLGAVASGLAVAALGTAGDANATCASISGIAAGTGCTSGLSSFAVGLGDNTTADASGLLSGAVAIGTNAHADATGTLNLAFAAGEDAYATSTGALNVAAAVGNRAYAETYGNLGLAATFGNDSTVVAGTSAGDLANVSLNLGDDSVVLTSGQGNIAASAGSRNSLAAIGGFNSAFNIGNDNILLSTGVINNTTNLLGDRNVLVAAGGTGLTDPGLNVAFNTLGSDNTVVAGPGPFAVAGAIGQNGALVTRGATGFNINGNNFP